MRKIEISSTHVRLSTRVMWRIGSFTRVTWHFWSFWSHMWRDKFDHLQVWDDKFNHLHVWRDTFDFICTCHVWSFTRVTWHIHTLDEPYLYLLHASFLCDIFTPRLRATNMSRYSSELCVPWLIIYLLHASFLICFMPRFFLRDTAYLYAWHDSCTRVAWLVHSCHVTFSCVSYDSSMRMTWLIHVWDMNHSDVWQD